MTRCNKIQANIRHNKKSMSSNNEEAKIIYWVILKMLLSLILITYYLIISNFTITKMEQSQHFNQNESMI
jgi:hypothetical protein